MLYMAKEDCCSSFSFRIRVGLLYLHSDLVKKTGCSPGISVPHVPSAEQAKLPPWYHIPSFLLHLSTRRRSLRRLKRRLAAAISTIRLLRLLQLGTILLTIVTSIRSSSLVGWRWRRVVGVVVDGLLVVVVVGVVGLCVVGVGGLAVAWLGSYCPAGSAPWLVTHLSAAAGGDAAVRIVSGRSRGDDVEGLLTRRA